MCGICGIYFFDRARHVDPGLLNAMNSLIIHRGPDEDGYFIERNLGLAMRRLRVIDLETGSQPVFNEDKSIITVFNGEIYNFPSLKSQLESLGHTFRTHCDTEVIVHAYEEWGLDFPVYFNGMFAIALYDKKNSRLILVRDRFGIKPLYFLLKEDVLVFGSELKTILGSGCSDQVVDDRALSFFMSLEYMPAPLTLVKDIKKMHPGSMLVIQGNSAKERIYYDLLQNIRPLDCPVSEIKERIRDELSKSVKRRLISDVPLGSFLSGGIDSSIIACLMKENHADPVRTFSVGFDESSYNELKYSSMVSALIGSEHTAFKLKPDILGIIDDLIYYLDEPIGDFSIFPTYMISKRTREHVTVALSGDGGDELFGGYEQYRAHLLSKPASLLPRFLVSCLIRAESRIRPSQKKKGIINNLKRFIQGLRFDSSLHHYRWMMFLDEKQISRLFPGLDNSSHFNEILGYIKELFIKAGGLDEVNRMGYADFSLYMQENILLKVDRMSMANSLEVRVPFLDHNLVELAFSIGGHYKIRRLRSKHILKEAFSNMLPGEIINREKQGFSIPVKNWIRGDLKDMVWSALTGAGLNPVFDPGAVRIMLQEHMNGSHNHSHNIWSAFIFQKWYERFIKNSLH